MEPATGGEMAGRGAGSSLGILPGKTPVRASLLVLALAVLALPAMSAAAQPPGPMPGQADITLKVKPHDPATIEGFEHFYNMEYDAAVQEFEQALKTHPNDPFAVNHLLEAVLFRELHREGALDAQLYMGKEFLHAKKVEVSPEVAAQINQLIQQASALSEAELKTNPNNVDALYALGVTHGMLATYTALVQKAWFKALRNGLDAYKDHKRILQINPNYSDAKLVVGIYNYVVGSLPWMVKAAAFLVAIHGSKSKGLELIHQAADGGGEASVDAKTTLTLFLAREKRYDEAIPFARELYQAFPRNFLYGLAAADLMRNAGQLPAAATAYEQLLSLSKQGKFQGEHVEFAAYNLGRTLQEEKKYPAAAEAYAQAASFPKADPQMTQRANLEAGQMYDLAGKRDLAVAKYQQVLAGDPETPEAKTARGLLRHPYRGS
jgi:tetratricopeptide (TPR) repeat protein